MWALTSLGVAALGEEDTILLRYLSQSIDNELETDHVCLLHGGFNPFPREASDHTELEAHLLVCE